MRETDKFYFFWKHQFRQWTKRNITDPDGITYNCCDQYMMYKKPRLFSNTRIAEKILAEPEPSNHQKLGREVLGYNEDVWDNHKFGIVWYGNFLKFTQHKDIGQRLIATGQKTIAEASPYDLVWGVGCVADSDEILNPDNWRGENLLGQVLISVRSAISIIDKKEQQA